MPEFRPPKWLSELADMFDVEGFEKPPPQQKIKRKAKIEIRNFEGIPMANLPAVLPKTKLVFRPADAFLFDMISFVTFLLVLGSIRLDSPRLDFLALISVALWIVRTVFRYSNKLARYDLLVKSFLTSKISHRNAGALKYIASEAGSQRAVRTALVYSWISNLVGAIKSPFRRLGDKSFTRESLLERAQDDINNLLETEKQVQIHVERALDDLEDLRLVTFDGPENQTLMGVLNPVTSVEAVRQKWMKFFDNCHEESWPGGNSTMSSSPSPRDIEETERWDPVETDFRTSFLNDVEQRRKQLTASLARSESSNNVKQIHAWQMGISSNTLNPAFDGPECQDEKRWHF